MRRRRFGFPVELPVIGQGTWNLEVAGRAAAVATLRRGLDEGMTHIDTAEMYGDGRVERIVGEAIAGRRDEVYLVSKVLPENASRAGTLEACERSLERLGTDRLDCYLLHWRGEHPLAETFAAFEQLVRDGKIVSFGLSNFGVSDLEQAVDLAGAGRIACNQVLYHLQERAIEHQVLPWCEAHGVAVVAYSPFGHSRFPGPRTPGGRLLAEIAAAHDATARQVALAFLVRQAPLFTIPKTSDPDRATENAAAGDLRLTSEEIARIDAAFPLGAEPDELPAL